MRKRKPAERHRSDRKALFHSSQEVLWPYVRIMAHMGTMKYPLAGREYIKLLGWDMVEGRDVRLEVLCENLLRYMRSPISQQECLILVESARIKHLKRVA